MDVQGKPTDDPELGYYGRAERAQTEEAYQAEKPPGAVADVPAQAENQPAEKAPPAQPEQPVSAAVPVPSVPVRPQGMLEGDWQRLLRNARNKEAVARDDAAMKARLH
jgi:hypothetical protein